MIRIFLIISLLMPLTSMAEGTSQKLETATPAVELQLTWHKIKAMQQQFPEPGPLPQDILMAPVSREGHIRQLNALKRVSKEAEKRVNQ